MLNSVMSKPTLIYDGKCGFCGIWIRYWKEVTGDAVEYAPFQEVAGSYPDIPRERFQQAVHWIAPDGDARSGAHAVYTTLAMDPKRRGWITAYDRVPGFASLSEAAYGFIARHRSLFYWVTVALFGREVHILTYDRVRWLFLKLLGLIYVVAFASFGAQAAGLIGSHGIEPVGLYLNRITEALGGAGFRYAPSLFWFAQGDAIVRGVCIAGVICGLLVVAGVFWRAALLVAFVLYLSLVNVSQEFLSYQWDYLLLEVGFLAIFLGYSRAVVWLYRWLLFRLMFSSGLVKLLSNDPAWHNLTALSYHYHTQPIPTPLAWYADHLPMWCQKASCASVFVIEIGMALLVLGPKRLRLIALPSLIGLQLLILLTGNYAFFNWLGIALCVFLLDDRILSRFVPGRQERVWIPRRVRIIVSAALVVIIGVVTASEMVGMYAPGLGRTLLAFTSPFGISSSYGLFAVMTTTRPEIIVEGSPDGVSWETYEFRYKAGPLNRRPPWVAPYQPRLDWQMWFAALGNYRENVWFLNFVARLLQGQPEVLALLARNPFPDRPPKYIRARVYEYRFTTGAERRAAGNWWQRDELGFYLRPVSLESLSGLPLLGH